MVSIIAQLLEEIMKNVVGVRFKDGKVFKIKVLLPDAEVEVSGAKHKDALAKAKDVAHGFNLVLTWGLL